MDHVGIDVHKKDSQICTLTREGEVLEVRVSTRAKSFEALFGGRSPTRVLLEASTESEWVARVLEGLGHEVIVADPNYAPMYGMQTRRVKTDRRDARALAEACRMGAYRPAHRRSEEQRHVVARLAVREALVRTRTRFISLTRALLRRDGIRLGSGEAESFVKRVAALELGGRLRSEVAPLFAAMQSLQVQIDYLDAVIERIAKQDPVVANLCTAPSIGPVTAAAFRAVVDEAGRFRDGHQVAAYVGLVPGEMSSGEKRRKGRITKVGDTRVRWLLVQAAQGIRRSKSFESFGLRLWAKRIESRRGKSIATVALARKLAGILFAMMRDGKSFVPSFTNHREAKAAA